MTLIEKRRLRGVKVLGYTLWIKRPRSEANHAALHVADGDHQPVAEAIVSGTGVLPLHQQPGLDELVDGVSVLRQVGPRVVPTGQTVAQPELLDRLLGQAAAGDVVPCCFGLRCVNQEMMIVLGRRVQKPAQPITKTAQLKTKNIQAVDTLIRPLLRGRAAVRGLTASMARSAMRLNVMAALRAETMQMTMSPSWSRCGQPRPSMLRPARNAAIIANGRAKTEWGNFTISAQTRAAEVADLIR